MRSGVPSARGDLDAGPQARIDSAHGADDLTVSVRREWVKSQSSSDSGRDHLGRRTRFSPG
jgi:hypothetical protein